MRQIVRALLVVFAFVVPWEYSLDIGEPIGNIARIVGLVLLLAAVPALLLKGQMRPPGPLHWLMVALFVWFCLSCFWTIDPPATLVRLRGYFQCMMPVWLIWEFAETTEDLRNLLRACVAGSWVLAVLTIASLASPEAQMQSRFVAQGQDPNDVARFLDLGFPVSALLFVTESTRVWKLLTLGYLPVGLVGVLLTASRGGFLVAVVAFTGCGLLLLRRHPRTLAVGVVSLPAIAASLWLLVPHQTLERIATIPEQLEGGDLNQRMNIWTAGWQAFAHAPFFGAGAGTFVQAARLAAGDTAHNTALTIVVEGGIVGLLLAAAILAVAAHSVLATRGAVRIGLGTALAVWLVTSLVATVEYSRTTWLLMGLLALACRLAHEEPEFMEECLPGEIPETLPAEAGQMP